MPVSVSINVSGWQGDFFVHFMNVAEDMLLQDVRYDPHTPSLSHRLQDSSHTPADPQLTLTLASSHSLPPS